MNSIVMWMLKTSYYAVWIVLPIVVLRLLLRRWPKWVFPILWGMVGLRLLLPLSIESPLSLIPRFPIAKLETPRGDHVMLLSILGIVWIIGASAMLLYGLISFLILRRKLGTAIREHDNIYCSEFVNSPFILGIIRPRIYLPFCLSGDNAAYVISHEKAHIKRKDHWWKPIGYGILCLYWFHPVVWIAYLFLCRDIELACDEYVVQNMTVLERAAYSQVLLLCAANRSLISICPLSFGSGGIGRRIRSVLSFRKTGRWVWFAVPVLTVIIGFCFMTVPESPKPHSYPDVTSEEQLYGTWTLDRIDYRTHEDEEIQTLKGNQIDLRLHLKFEPDGVVFFLTERNCHETIGVYQVSDNVVTIHGKDHQGTKTKLHMITAIYNTEDDTLRIPVESLCTEYFSRSSEPSLFQSASAAVQGNR